ncbi:MAG: DUF4366 domain-containing protein [Oscillospiraceae bacterium]|jgi:hypothetical protein|nr:DUF4366 domain-containing protein [Oscillospiraceae bacterium]
MSISKKSRLLPLAALMLVIGAFIFSGTVTAYAADIPASEPTPTAVTEATADSLTLIVKEVWLTGETLHISVIDRNTGVDQTLELNLPDYANSGDEYVTVQATDSSGNKSNTIQFKNPYYQAVIETTGESDTTEKPASAAVDDSATPTNSGNPLTPDGTGTVLDKITNENGKEFFTVETPDGNVFYIIVDRERESDNVYLLNAVNEDDLASLAKSGDGMPVSAVTVPEVTPTPAPVETTPTPEPEPQKSGNSNTGTIAFIVIAVVVFGGAAYYFKIVRPKKYSADTNVYDEPEDSIDDDDESEIVDDGDPDDREEDETE